MSEFDRGLKGDEFIRQLAEEAKKGRKRKRFHGGPMS